MNIQFNLGLDMSLLRNRLEVTLIIIISVQDVILQYLIHRHLVLLTIMQICGEIKNRGVELAVQASLGSYT